MDFEKDLTINKNSLDQELIEQAHKMLWYSSAHAQAMYDRDRAKQGVDITKAGLDATIRAELNASGTKFTEAVVDGKIRQHPNFIDAQDKYQKAELEVNLLMGVVMAMNARRSMLENLVKLYLNGYWAEPRVGDAEVMTRPTVASEQAIIQAQSKAPTQPTPSPLMYIIQASDDPTVDCSHGPFPNLGVAVKEMGANGSVIVELHRIDAGHRKVMRWWDQATGLWSDHIPVAPAPPQARPPLAPPPSPAPRPGPTPVPQSVPAPALKPTNPDDVPF